MKTATVTGFRQRMKEHLSEIQSNQDILILTGPKKMGFVVLTLDAYNAMEETAYLLSTPANTERLLESVAQDKAGNAVVRQLALSEEKQPGRRTSIPKASRLTAVRRKK